MKESSSRRNDDVGRACSNLSVDFGRKKYPAHQYFRVDELDDLIVGDVKLVAQHVEDAHHAEHNRGPQLLLLDHHLDDTPRTYAQGEHPNAGGRLTLQMSGQSTYH